jgi:hypothetical protein
MIFREFDWRFRMLAEISMHGRRRFARNCPFFYGKITYMLPMFNDGHSYLVGHQHPNSDAQRWIPLTPKNSSFRLTRIRYDDHDMALMQNAVPVEVFIQVDDKNVCCLNSSNR